MKSNFSSRFKCGVSAIAVAAILPIGIQSSYAANEAAAENEVSFEEVVVTGSRIKRGNLSTSTPVTVLDSEAIKVTGAANVAEILRELPSVGLAGLNTTNSNFLTSSAGINTVNLRNLGDDRTLTLVNGRRFVAGVSGTSQVDLNMIPAALIERFEVVTGGASAVYGSEAIAGVVNFILKDDFEGVAVDGQYGISGKGDMDEITTGVTVGANFADDRGNATVHFAYNKEFGLFSRERGIDDTFYSRSGEGTLFEPANSSYPPQGRFLGASWTYDPSGNLINSFSSAVNGFNRSEFRRIAVPTKRMLFASTAHYDVNEYVTAYVEGSYAQTETRSNIEPFAFASSNIYQGAVDGMPLDNPFIPQAILDDITAQNAAQAILNADADPDNDAPLITALDFKRRLLEFGDRTSQANRNTFRVVLGLKGDITEDWSYDASYTYGRTIDAQNSDGQISTPNFRDALDVEADPTNPGGYRCKDVDARAEGCVPVNVFGMNSISAAAVQYLAAPKSRRATITQQVLSASVSNGNVFTLPGGDVGFAVGIEHRREASETLNDALTQSGQNAGNRIPNTKGEYDVTEGFAELSVPIISDVEFAKYIGLEAAFRYADYSTVGGVSSWKIGGDWTLNDDVRFRAVYAKATRAPNIGELFSGQSQTFPSGLTDPCDNITASAAPNADATQAANCRAIPGVAAAISNAGIFTVPQVDYQTIDGLNGGNIALFEETAYTLTAGVVFTPTFLEGFSLSVDYYDIKIDDAIQSVARQTSINECLSSADPASSPFCNNVIRGADGKIDRVNAFQLNLATKRNRGIDVATAYDLDMMEAVGVEGNLNFGLNYTLILKAGEIPFEGADYTDFLGEIPDVKHRARFSMTYTGANLTLGYNMTYIGSVKDDLDGGNYSLNDIGTVTYHDLQARYSFGEDGQYEVYGGVNNVFDKAAPFLPSGTQSGDTGTDTNSMYDPVGRYFYFGAKAKF
ncbi:TonB-dependent receptor domain-containing protein [Paremcibacter congregatus]|uniref:TonB-dependent receptor domain-containing protein n=1 Tax=Paremcibacter congregatus TaxID=2043170 RepID=UPI0030EC6E35|tara:strand:- start:3372 stop:6278 length:2907 start_codon:yes stop_codon:yes gene_type:complete